MATKHGDVGRIYVFVLRWGLKQKRHIKHIHLILYMWHSMRFKILETFLENNSNSGTSNSYSCKIRGHQILAIVKNMIFLFLRSTWSRRSLVLWLWYSSRSFPLDLITDVRSQTSWQAKQYKNNELRRNKHQQKENKLAKTGLSRKRIILLPRKFWNILQQFGIKYPVEEYYDRWAWPDIQL